MLRRTTFAVITLAGALTIAFVGMELALRAFLPTTRTTRVEVKRQTIPGIQREVTYERNEFGLRSLSLSSEHKPSATVRILVLGGSTTDAPYQDSGDTWWGHLDERLRARFGPAGVQVEVAAFGRGGRTAIDRLAWARANLERFDPDVVVTLEGINDLAWHGGADYHYSDLPSALAAASSPARRHCSDWSQVCRRLEQLEQRLTRQARGDTVELEWHSENLPELTRAYRSLPLAASIERPQDPFVEFSAALEALIAFASSPGRQVVVLAQPVLWQPDLSPRETERLWFSIATPAGPVRASPAWLAAEMDRYNRRQAELAARYGARYVAAPVPADLEHFFDDCHFTDLGSRRMADLIEAEMVRAVEAALRARRRVAGAAPRPAAPGLSPSPDELAGEAPARPPRTAARGEP